MSRLPAQERYMRDFQFKALVDALYHMLCDMNMTPTEVREAAMLAAIMFETNHVRPMLIRREDEQVNIKYMSDKEYKFWRKENGI